MLAAGTTERSRSQINAEAQAVHLLLGQLTTACHDLEAEKKLAAIAKEHLLQQKQQRLQQQQQEEQEQAELISKNEAPASGAAGKVQQGGVKAGAPAAAAGGSMGAATLPAGIPQPLVGKYGKYLNAGNFFLEVVAPELDKKTFPYLAPVLQRLTDMSNGVVSETWCEICFNSLVPLLHDETVVGFTLALLLLVPL